VTASRGLSSGGQHVDGRRSCSGWGLRVWPIAERRPVPAAGAVHPARQARRAATNNRHAALARRAVLCRAHRLSVAAPASPSGFSALAYRIRLLQSVPRGGRVGEPAPPSRCHAAGRRRTAGQSLGGHHRHPERQDDGKRGPRGWDAAKRLKGRKRHVAVDTQGLLLGVVVQAADIQDADGLWDLLKRLKPLYPWLRAVFADSIYNRFTALLACFLFGLTLILVRRVAGTTGFLVQPRRWVVERSLDWLGRRGGLSQDYEERPEVSEAMVTLAMIRLMLHRLACPNCKRRSAP